jgi:hypothetical protein
MPQNHTEDFQAIVTAMTGAICSGDGRRAADYFAEEGAYHDCFYGEFVGREAIADMVENYFHRDARDLSWRVYDCCACSGLGYARYDFSYTSTLAASNGARIDFPGMLCCQWRDGLIQHYGEIFERAPVMARLGFADARILKAVKRWAQG